VCEKLLALLNHGF